MQILVLIFKDETLYYLGLWSWLWFFFSVWRHKTNILMPCFFLHRSAAVHLTVPLYGREEEPSDVSRETQTRRPPLRTGTQPASDDERGERFTMWRHSAAHLKLLPSTDSSSLQRYCISIRAVKARRQHIQTRIYCIYVKYYHQYKSLISFIFTIN